MKVAVVHNRPDAGKADSEDVLREVDFVTGALDELGADYHIFSCERGGNSIGLLLGDLGSYGPNSIFNLVESLGEDQRLYPAVASLFEAAGYPYTGSPYDALLITTDKVLTKAVLQANEIPSPRWSQYYGKQIGIDFPGPWIIKPAWEDASVGIEDSSVIVESGELIPGIEKMYRDHDQPVLVEQYVDGREFNIALLESPDGNPEVMPIAEMMFRDWPERKPKIVNYSAKWDESSFEYRNTVRQFNPPDTPIDLIGPVAIKCWKSFNLGGYARVDMRLDRSGNAFVIEVNTNPCISPDAGFIAATREGGYGDKEVIKRILDASLKKGGRRHG